MKLHGIEGKNSYCGPSAVSAIAGIRTELAADLMRQRNGRRAIRGAYNSEVRHALESLGYDLLLQHQANLEAPLGRTYAAWTRQTARLRGKRVYLIAYGWHFAVVRGRKHFCSQRRDGCSLKEAPKRRAKMENVWEVIRNPLGPKVKPAELVAVRTSKRRARQPDRRARRQARKLLAAWPQVHVNVDVVEQGVRHIWVTCSLFRESEEGDPFEGDHIVSDWSEALPRIEEYIEVVKKHSVVPTK